MNNAASHDQAHIRLRDVRMSFDDRGVFADLSCEFPRGQVSVILGGSGVGKSTLLRLIAGLVRPDTGQVEVAGQDITQLTERELRAVRSRIGMLFQGGALLDSLSVFDNLALPLREHHRLERDELTDRIHRRLDEVGLEPEVARLLPAQLSGGMLRRAALARAMILEPEILLCDEPFSGLDPMSLHRIERLLADVNQKHGITVLVVSHHIASTMRLAARTLLLLPDRSVCGSPAELRASDDPEVAEFFDEEVVPGGSPPARPESAEGGVGPC
jgi:phospholipid/cholesterol/gamma-HCH transport system ATP-binding protein